MMPMALIACPAFRESWNKHRQFWQDEEAGIYNDLAEFADFIVDQAYGSGDLASVDASFALTERFFDEGDDEVREAAMIGFLEDVHNLSSHRPFGAAPFIERLGPLSKRAWAEVEEMWRGKNSLADVIRGERKAREKS
jgi:hypothetical protein